MMQMKKTQHFIEESTDPRVNFLLRLGDDALVLAQRLIGWCGHAPTLELDVALSNLSLDGLGQARHWLTLAGEIEGKGRHEDDFAYWRDPNAFSNLILVEQPNGDFAVTIMRQCMFSVYQHLVYQSLTDSNDTRVADLAGGSVPEVAYHVRFTTEWVRRLALGTEESHRRLQDAIKHLWRYQPEMFDRDDIDQACLASGFAPLSSSLESDWMAHMQPLVDECQLELPDIGKATYFRGGRQGRHSEHLHPLLSEMQSVARQHPGATW